jgi:hypothetical protein
MPGQGADLDHGSDLGDERGIGSGGRAFCRGLVGPASTHKQQDDTPEGCRQRGHALLNALTELVLRPKGFRAPGGRKDRLILRSIVSKAHLRGFDIGLRTIP